MGFQPLPACCIADFQSAAVHPQEAVDCRTISIREMLWGTASKPPPGNCRQKSGKKSVARLEADGQAGRRSRERLGRPNREGGVMRSISDDRSKELRSLKSSYGSLHVAVQFSRFVLPQAGDEIILPRPGSAGLDDLFLQRNRHLELSVRRVGGRERVHVIKVGPPG